MIDSRLCGHCKHCRRLKVCWAFAIAFTWVVIPFIGFACGWAIDHRISHGLIGALLACIPIPWILRFVADYTTASILRCSDQRLNSNSPRLRKSQQVPM